MTRFIVIILSLLMFQTNDAFAQAKERKALYGVWEEYSANIALKYPNFTLHFVGAEPGAFYPNSTTHRMGSRYKFMAVWDKIAQPVSWSSGTGDIAPSKFIFDGRDYILEMRASLALEEKGFVPDNKVILWRAAEWQKKRDANIEKRNKRYGEK
jgi:hypothetical protein